MIAHFLYSDGQDPKTLTEQVLSIYPILSGHQASGGNINSPKTTESQAAESKAAPTPAPTSAAPATSTRDDLIDFGNNDAPAEPSQPHRPAAVVNPAVESTGEISGLLKATGKPADGPLLNFTQDLKTSIPEIRQSEVESGEDLKK